MKSIACLAALVALAGCGRDEGPGSDPVPDEAVVVERPERLAAQGQGYLDRAEAAVDGAETRAEAEEALDLYRRAIVAFDRAGPTAVGAESVWRTHRGHVELLMLLGRHEEAIEATKRAKGTAPTDEDTRWLELERLRAEAEVALASDDFPVAIRRLERSVAIDPGHRDGQVRLDGIRRTWLLLLKRRLRVAESLEDVFVARFGQRVETSSAHEIYFRMYDLARMAQAEEGADEAFLHLKEAVGSLRQLEADMGPVPFAERGYHALLSHFSNLSGLVLIELGQYELAQRAFEAAAGIDPENEVASENARTLGL